MYSLLLSIAAIIIATKLFGELSRRMGQPSVLGELIAGVLLGGSALGIVDPRDPAMRALGEIGLFVLIFQIGVHADVRSLRRAGSSAVMVAIAGAVLPFTGGFVAARALGVSVLAAVIAGASLTATSMAISARVLGDQGVLRTREGQVVVSAALADVVIGLVVLSVAVGVAGSAAVSGAQIGRTSLITAGFIVVGLAVGRYAIPPLFRVLDGIRAKGSLGMFGIAFGALLAALSVASGTAMIVGAFVAGMILHATPQRHEIERTTQQLGHFFVPIFFAIVGASVNLGALAAAPALELSAALVVIGIVGKVIAGYAPLDFRGNKLLIGTAMTPRGEIGLIIAQAGLATGAITPEVFGAMIVMVVVTTFVSPPMLESVISRDDSLEREHVESPDIRHANGRRQTTAGRRH